jgi:hypothetical protein
VDISDDEADEETDSEGEGEDSTRRSRNFGLGDDIDEQMKRAVWGTGNGPEEQELGDEEDIDFDAIMEEEEGDFIKFAQDALGITDDMMQGIVSSRKARGGELNLPARIHSSHTDELAFVPTKEIKSMPTAPESVASASRSAKRPPVSNTPTPPVQAESGEGEVNMSLDSFDKVMEAMDAELAKAKAAKRSKGSEPVLASSSAGSSTTAPKVDKSKSAPLPKLPTEQELDDLDGDDLLAMDRELKAALKSAGVNSDDEDDDDEGIEEVRQLDDEGKREYNMMKDFLESYKSQGGNAGVVGNLFGRLGEKK